MQLDRDRDAKRAIEVQKESYTGWRERKRDRQTKSTK